MNTSKPNFLTTVTVANIGLDKPVLRKIAEKAKGKETAICRVVGQATGMKAGETEKGTYVKFSGLYQAINYANKQEYRSGNCILPNVAAGLLEGLLGGALANMDKDTSGVAIVFAYEITVKGDETAATGYVFGCRSLMEAGDDPLAEVLAKLPAIPTTKLLA